MMIKKRTKEQLYKLIPPFSIFPLIGCFLWNTVIYNGSRFITSDFHHYDMTTAIDRRIPLIPEFMLIYWGCFVIWIIFYIMCMRVNKDYCAKFFTFDVLSRTICGIFFLLLPTCNVRPFVPNQGVFNQILLFLYKLDAADNLFPSIHCLVSWNCFVGIRNVKIYPKKYTWFAFISALLVFASTLFTKQHVIVDLISAVIVSELSWIVVNHTTIYQKSKKLLKYFQPKK